MAKPLTEAEWLACVEPGRMLSRYPGTLTERKARLFACACCRRIWHLIDDDKCREAVALSERYADAQIGEDRLRAGWEGAMEVARQIDASLFSAIEEGARRRSSAASAACYSAHPNPNTSANLYAGGRGTAESSALSSAMANFPADWQQARAEQRQLITALLREIVGNPFRPVMCQPTWRTPDVLALAQGIYDERAFDRMPILADALLDAGCDDADILAHCRSDEAHWLGCWVVDLVLGKA